MSATLPALARWLSARSAAPPSRPRSIGVLRAPPRAPPPTEERRELEEHLSLLYSALGAGLRDAALAELRALAAALVPHFEEEEQWMEAERYPERHTHARSHSAGRQAFLDAVEGYELAGTAAQFLADRAIAWLEIHLEREDPRFGRFLAERDGVGSA